MVTQKSKQWGSRTSKQQSYHRLKEKLFSDENICEENKELWKEFFIVEEKKLRRMNESRELDEKNYHTLQAFPNYFRNINKWFNNKSWKDLTKEEIRNVLERLEDNKILTKKGTPIKDKRGYYTKIFLTKPFKLADKNELVREVIDEEGIRIANISEEVKFFTEKTFKKMLNHCIPQHRLLLWLLWDIGENINGIVTLQKEDFERRIGSNGEVEYLVRLRKEKIKRSRTARAEHTYYDETAELLDIYIPQLKPKEYLFPWGLRFSDKIIQKVCKKEKLVCVEGQKISPKVFRSSMACNMLLNDYTTDEIKSRLGHKPSSRVLDKYVSYLALNKKKIKEKINHNNVNELRREIVLLKQRDKIQDERFDRLTERLELLYKKEVIK